MRPKLYRNSNQFSNTIIIRINSMFEGGNRWCSNHILFSFRQTLGFRRETARCSPCYLYCQSISQTDSKRYSFADYQPFYRINLAKLSNDTEHRAVSLRRLSTWTQIRVLGGHHCVVALGSYLHLCASVTKQYNLVQAKGRGWSLRLGK